MVNESLQTYPVMPDWPELAQPLKIREIGLLFGFCTLFPAWIAW